MTKRSKIILILCIVIAGVLLLVGGALLLFRNKITKVPVVPVAIEMLSNEDQPTQPREPEGKIVLISRRVNYAWGYDDSGLFVDSEGYVHCGGQLGNAVDVRYDARHFSDKALKETAKSRQYNS